MKTLAKSLFVVAVLSLLLTAATWPVEHSYAARAKMVQRVQRDAGNDLFGDSGTPIGTPHLAVVDDAKAFLPDKGPNDVALLDENYLVKNQIHPLQMQTVTYVLGLVRMGATLAAIAFLLVGFFVQRRVSVAGAPKAP